MMDRTVQPEREKKNFKRHKYQTKRMNSSRLCDLATGKFLQDKRETT